MKLKNYFIIFCLLMVLVGCAGAASAASDDSINNGQSGVGTTDNPIPVMNNNQALGVGAVPASSAQGENNGGNSIQSSPGEDNSSNKLSESGGSEFYVSTQGSDDNPGTQDSPFLTINKAISSADASKNTIIHIGAGTFSGTLNTNLAIDVNRGSSLTIIGEDGKTVIDGGKSNRFITSIGANSIVIIKNIYINNTHAPIGQNGGAINTNGALTVENCIFNNTYAIYENMGGRVYGGAIYSQNSLTVINSTFENTYAQASQYSYGGAIAACYASGNVEIINNTFINCKSISYNTGYGSAVYSYAFSNTKISGNKFINITATQNAFDAGLYVMGYTGYAIEVTDNTFENCNNLGTKGAVMAMTNYISSYSGNKFINSSSYAKGLVYTTSYNFDFIVNINDVTTTKPTFSLSANVTDIDGNTLSFGTSLQFFINGENVGAGQVNAGISTVEISKLYDNGEYKITAKLNGADKPSWRNGTLTVNIGRTPVDIWVDAENGVDVETAGNETNPFKSIKYAIEQGLLKSIYPTIHIKNGVYSGENNNNLVVDSLCEIAFIGEAASETIIDCEGSNAIFTLTQDGTVTFKNISFINAKSTAGVISSSSRTVTVDNCIFKNCTTTGQGGAIYALGTTDLDCTITNTEFLNCSGTGSYSSAFWVDEFNKIVFENNSIVNFAQKWDSNSNPSRGAGQLSGQTVFVSNNKFINNSAMFGYNIDLYFNSRVSGIANNNTFINSQGTSRVQSSLAFSECRGNVNITNNKFINTNLTVSNYYGILYLDRANFYLENNAFINTTNSTPTIMVKSGKVNGKIVILNKTINSNIFNLTAYITDIDGNPIQCKNVYFYIDDEEVGQIDSVNGVATLDCLKYLSDGEYTINCSCTYLQDALISTGTLKVNIPINPKEYYISASAGDDENGDGTKVKPFKTLKKALDQSLVDHSYDVTINVMDGTYSGEGNVNLALNNSFAGVLKIIGENYNKAIFDGNDNAHMFWINDYYSYGIPNTLKVSIENITFANFAYDDSYGSLIRSDAAELNLTGCIFDSIYAGSRSSYGPVIYQRNDLNIKDSIFKTITSDYMGIIGGYVQYQYQTVTLIKIDNCTFIDCISKYSIVDAVTQLSNSTFENCSAQRDRQELSIVTSRSNATFVNNKFINNVASGGVLLNYDVATVINNTFIGNTISYIAPINSYSDLIIIDSKFINNTGITAGVIYTGSSLNLTNNVFENNKQGSKLNDINAKSGAEISGLTLTISNIDSNQLMNDIVAELSSADGAIVTGGQVEFYANGTSLGKKSLTNNNAFITYTFANNGKYVLNATYNRGGNDLIVKTGVAIINASTVEFNELYVSDSKGDDINGNGSILNPFKTIKKAVYYSAGHDNVTIHVLEGIYKGMQNTNIKIDTSKLTIVGEGRDKTIIDGENNNYFFNIANGNIVFSNLTFINGFSSTITIAKTASLVLDNIKYENNTRESGNGIRNEGSLTITDSEFYNNGNTKDAQSGIIYSTNRDSIIKMYNSKFVNTVGTYASVIYTQGEILIDNCIFSNSSNSRYVIFNNNQNALVNVTSSIFTDNLATCIYGKVYVVNSNFTNNYAINDQQTSGGAIYSTNTGYVSNCIFTNNSAKGQGGAMYFYGEIYNSEFYNNTASINNGGAGGAIYLASYNVPSTIENCYFEGNKALMGRGNDLGAGAIYVRGSGASSKITITSCTFVNNSAIDSAGAIRNYNGYTTISDSEFINNHAGKNGGAVSTYAGSTTIVNSKFINNTADANGGAIEISRSIPTIIDNCLFEENTALDGGAIVITNTQQVAITKSNFTKNNAVSSGGAISGSGTITVSYSVFDNNTASMGGAMSGTGFTVSYSTFINNTAESGSAIYSTNYYNVNLQNNNWWGINDNPNQFISTGYEIETWVIANILPNITNIVVGENKTFTVYFTNNTGGELTDFIPIRPIVVYDDSYNLEKNNATINVLAKKTGIMTISVDNEIFEFNVDKATPTVNITYSENPTYGNNITVYVNMTGNYAIPSGSVVINVNGKDYAVNLTDGVASADIGILNATNYKVTVSYSGDDNYVNTTQNSTLSVAKAKANFNVEVSNIKYGDVETINVTADKLFSGDVKLNVGNETYTISLVNGFGSENVTGLTPNNYSVSVEFAGNDNYLQESTNPVNIVVSKADVKLSIIVKDIVVGEVENVIIQATPDINETVTVKLNNQEKTVTLSQGIATIPYSGLTLGDYEITVELNETSNYNAAEASATFTVVPYNIVTNSTFSYFFDENGNLKDNITVDSLIFEGAFSNLGVNAINITKSVDLIGNNAVLEDIGLIISADDVTVDNFAINLSNESDAVAAVIVIGDDVCVENSVITVNSSEDADSFAVLVEGAEDFVLTNNTINYTGNSDGSAVNNAIRLEDADGAVIEDNIINISIPSVPVTYTPPTWEATVLSEGIVVDSSDDVVLSNNTINVDYNKVTGAYDSVYAVEFVDSDNAVITDNEITTNGNSYAYGLTINGENFTVEGNNITTTSNNYANGIQIAGPASGNVSDNNIDAEAPSVVYPIYSYGTDLTYTDNNISGTSNSVYAMELFGTNETVKDNNIVANGNFTIGVASGSKNLVLENNTIIANGTNKGTPTTGDSIKSETTGVKAVSGNAVVTNNTIISTGDSAVKTEASGYIANNTLVANDTTGDAAVDYTPNQALIVDDNVPKMEKVFITADDIVMYYKNGTRYVITLSDGSGNLLANKPVTITINGVSYSRATNAQGTTSVALNLAAGNYTASASFAGDENYGKASIENTVTILSTISADNLVKVHKNASQYYATFTDGQGNPLANTDVTFNINGVMYTRKTNENGTAKLNINLDQGTFIITATNPINGETHSNNITVLSRIVDNKDLVKYYKNASQYVVTLLGDDGNPVGAGETVTFNINGVFYTRTTNATGQAKLNINLDPGVFVITAEYKGCKVSNTVTVKPVLSASDLTKKYGTPDQFIATLLDGQGNPVDGEIVTFNINGVFYNRITRDGGQAKLNINLQPGEFIITSSYNGTSISNTVKVEA